MRSIYGKSDFVFKNKVSDLFLIGLFLLSFSLRFVLVWNNRQSNDDHIQVIQLILASSRLPVKADCWECFQPKLFHFTAAKVVQGLGLAGLGSSGLAFVAEIINMLAGLITLAVVWAFIVRLPAKNKWLKVLAFGLVALNPMLIGINSQATNDTFAILFSTLAIFNAYVFFQREKITTFLLMILFSCLGIASKTNAWVTAIGIAGALLVQIFLNREERKKRAYFAVIFLTAVPILTILNPLAQYVENYETSGTPVTMNIDTVPLPPLYGKTTYNDRGGILSIRDGFFTFRFIDLLKHPRLDYEYENYPISRTSFWTMIYATANSASFQDRPPSWSLTGTQGFMLARGIFSLALLPVLLLLVGSLSEPFFLLRSLYRRDIIGLQMAGYGLFALIFFGYIAFAILYALMYQTFLVLKAIFIFPAFLVFLVLFLRSAEPVYGFLSKRLKWSVLIFNVDIIMLLALYTTEIIMLVNRIRGYH